MKYLKDEILSLLKRLSESKDNLTILFMNFSIWALLAYGTVIILSKLFDVLSVSNSVGVAVQKIIICVSPIIPTLRIWSMRESFGGDSGVNGGVMDCCFSVWAAIIIFAQIL